jgi:hypothetical protein
MKPCRMTSFLGPPESFQKMLEIAAIANLGAAWRMIYSIRHICDMVVLSSNSPWTCLMDHIFYDASVVWGLMRP